MLPLFSENVQTHGAYVATTFTADYSWEQFDQEPLRTNSLTGSRRVFSA